MGGIFSCSCLIINLIQKKPVGTKRWRKEEKLHRISTLCTVEGKFAFELSIYAKWENQLIPQSTVSSLSPILHIRMYCTSDRPSVHSIH